MQPTTAEHLAQLVVDLELVPETAVREVVRESGGQGLDAAGFGHLLVRRELITGFQLERLLKGEQRGYFFGRVKLLYQVGAGSFARVYRGVHRDTGATLAVKVLRRRFADDAGKRLAFRREGEMGRLLRHTNIVAIEDVGEEHGSAYLVMEFLEGGTLREVVKIRGAIEPPRALHLILQVLAGLEYAHRRGVTHRDIKASNVLVSATGVAKLVDFGLARVDDTGDRALGRMEQPRTVDYAALEKLTGMQHDDVRSDVYFTGTLAYLVLAGRPALAETRDRGQRAEPRRFKAVEPLAALAPALPRDVVDVVARMMHLDPLQRFQTAADAKRAVEQVGARMDADGRKPAVTTGPVDATDAGRPAPRGSVMVVESAARYQEILRTYFIGLGFRVLLTENPRRALTRFASHPPPADLLVISGQTLGAEALRVFNSLPADPFLAELPVILLAGAGQEALVAAAFTDGKHRVLSLPAATAEVTKLLEDLLPSRPQG